MSLSILENAQIVAQQRVKYDIYVTFTNGLTSCLMPNFVYKTSFIREENCLKKWLERH